MKTLRTIAAVIVAVVLVFGPTVAFAATTVSVTPNATSYSGQQTIQVSGTVSPAPSSASSSVVVTTKGPMGVVDIGLAPVATGTGTYTYTYVSGGSVAWVSGAYTVNATWGFGGEVASSTATFQYTASGNGGGSGGNPTTAINVQVTASTPTIAGQPEYVAILTSFAQNGSLAGVTFQTVHFHTPQGTLVTLCSSSPPATGCTGTFATIHKGFYQINFTAPATAGGYFIHAWTNSPIASGVSSGQGQGLGQFTVQTTTSGGGGSSDAAALTAIQSTLTTIQSSLTGLTTTVNGIQSSIAVLTAGFGTINTNLQGVTTTTSGLSSTLSAIQSSLNSVSTGVTGITSSLSGLQSSITTINGIGSQLTSLNNAINNNQTYVLVVAALAAITLVLELAILVRKLS